MFRSQPPENFDFTATGNWQTWRQRFQRFRIVSKLSKVSAKTQVSTLIYCMGTKGEQIY